MVNKLPIRLPSILNMLFLHIDDYLVEIKSNFLALKFYYFLTSLFRAPFLKEI